MSVAKEYIKHGTNHFPLGCYFWNGGKYSVHLTLHWHPECEILCFDVGSSVVTVGAQQVTVEAPCFMLIPCNAVHTLVLPGNTLQRAVVFNPEMVRLSKYDKAQNDIFQSISGNFYSILPVLGPDSPYFAKAKRCFNYIASHYDDRDPLMKLQVKLRLASLLAVFASFGMFRQTEFFSEVEQKRLARFKELITWINGNFAKPLSVREAAARMQVSESYFCRIFKKTTHMSFTEYLNDFRLVRAADIIMGRAHNIADVASEVGFENESYFFRLFKRKYGVTPLKFRQDN